MTTLFMLLLLLLVLCYLLKNQSIYIARTAMFTHKLGPVLMLLLLLRCRAAGV